jgi:hypothetical protein
MGEMQGGAFMFDLPIHQLDQAVQADVAAPQQHIALAAADNRYIRHSDFSDFDLSFYDELSGGICSGDGSSRVPNADAEDV